MKSLAYFHKSVQRAISGLLFGVLLTLAPGTLRANAEHAIAVPELVEIPAGRFILGSSDAARGKAYDRDRTAYKSDITRKQEWYKFELQRRTQKLAAFSITTTPITNRQYAAFIAATGHRAPDVNPGTWDTYRVIQPYKLTRRHAWLNGKPPMSREDHPVVLVSYDDAFAYAQWLSKTTKKLWRLPTEKEWEKAARGPHGLQYPWGNMYNPNLLNSADTGPADTIPVGQFPRGASPYGMLDAAGQVYEWTATPFSRGRVVVKGGAWDDKGCGVCRPAARHSRPLILKHILIGFRLVSH